LHRIALLDAPQHARTDQPTELVGDLGWQVAAVDEDSNLNVDGESVLGEIGTGDEEGSPIGVGALGVERPDVAARRDRVIFLRPNVEHGVPSDLAAGPSDRVGANVLPIGIGSLEADLERHATLGGLAKGDERAYSCRIKLARQGSLPTNIELRITHF
jgi:hypothetical protein